VNISKLLNFKVVEADACIAVVPEAANVGMPGAANLIIADMRTCCEYLSRYTEARSSGLEVREAHQKALVGANVLAKGGLDS
jgi:hypothetical protein